MHIILYGISKKMKMPEILTSSDNLKSLLSISLILLQHNTKSIIIFLLMKTFSLRLNRTPFNQPFLVYKHFKISLFWEPFKEMSTLPEIPVFILLKLKIKNIMQKIKTGSLLKPSSLTSPTLIK
jgi:hypothetical protein